MQQMGVMLVPGAESAAPTAKEDDGESEATAGPDVEERKTEEKREESEDEDEGSDRGKVSEDEASERGKVSEDEVSERGKSEGEASEDEKSEDEPRPRRQDYRSLVAPFAA